MRAAACWVSSVLVCCGGAESRVDSRISPGVEAQFTTARDATVPSGVTLAQSTGLKRSGAVVGAEWSFANRTGWAVYGSQVKESLQKAGYGLLKATDEALVFTKRIPGDAYRVRIERKGPASTQVTVTFTASPD